MSLKVVVIDDKPMIRRAIVETMDWSALDCEVVGSGEDGLSGKLLIEQHHPDIIITDIRMPGMDGLELLEYAGTILKHFKAIVITGYEDFNFAKTCLRLGVTEYILKPLNNDEIFEAVKKISTQLLKERGERSEREQMLPTVKRQMISDILIGRIPLEEIKNWINLDKLSAYRYGVILISDSKVPAWDVNAAPVPGTKGINRLMKVMDQALSEDFVEVHKVHLINDLVIVLLFHKSASERHVKQLMDEFGRRIKELMTIDEQKELLLEWSSPFKNLDHLREEYLELSRKLTLNFFHSAGVETMDKLKMSIFFDLEEFKSTLDSNSTDELEKQARTLLSRISTYAAGNVIVARALISELCLTIAKHYYKYSNSEKMMGKSVDILLEDVNRLPDMVQVGDYIALLIRELKKKQDSEQTPYSTLIKNILHYIDENYNKDLNLNLVAEQFQISSGHLSRLLRKETQTNFVDIVSKTRISAAKRLMRDPTKRIQEISEMTGFNNYIYFYQVFKKYEKISPQEYKNNVQK